MTSNALAAPTYPRIDDADLNIKLSSDEVQVNQQLVVNITVNTTQPLYYQWGRVIISSLDTGYIISTASINLTSKQNLTIVYPGSNYTLYCEYIYEPHRPIMFGEYTVWVTVGNMSAFERVTIVPSLGDFYTDLRNMERKYEESQNNYWYIIRIVYPAAFMLSAMTILICYYLWRLPDSSKEELKYWLLSKGDVRKLEMMQRELRDIDRKQFNARNAPSVGRNEKIIRGLHAKKRVLEKLKFYTDKRIEKMKRVGSNAGEFSEGLVETIKVLDEEIATRNADIVKALSALEIEAQKRNRKLKPERPQERRMSPMDLDRFRRMARRKEVEEEEE